MGHLRRLAKKCRYLGKTASDDLDAPTFAEGGHADWIRIGLLPLKEEIDKPLRKLEDCLNEIPGILSVFDLNKSPDHSSRISSLNPS